MKQVVLLTKLVDGDVDLEGYIVWLIGSFKQHIYLMLIGLLGGFPLPSDCQQVSSLQEA